MDTRNLTAALNNEFSSKDVNELTSGFSHRYVPFSNKVGHAVIMKDKEGKKIAKQYAIPQGGEGMPEFLPLKDIQEIHPFGMTRYCAKTLDDTPMVAKRFIRGEVDGESFEIACFSPRRNDDDSYWGSDNIPGLFKPNNHGDKKIEVETDQEDDQQAGLVNRKTKGPADWVAIEPERVLAREQLERPFNKNTMYSTAREEHAAFWNEWDHELTDEMKRVLTRILNVSFATYTSSGFYSQFFPEWIHAIPFILAPSSVISEQSNNLGAAAKWVNVEMMVLTHIVRWYAHNRPEAVSKILPHFKMLLGSQLIERILYQVNIEENNHRVTLKLDVSPFKKGPIFRKSTDTTQGVAVVYNMLQGNAPVSTLSIFAANEKKRERGGEVDNQEQEMKKPRFET